MECHDQLINRLGRVYSNPDQDIKIKNDDDWVNVVNVFNTSDEAMLDLSCMILIRASTQSPTGLTQPPAITDDHLKPKDKPEDYQDSDFFPTRPEAEVQKLFQSCKMALIGSKLPRMHKAVARIEPANPGTTVCAISLAGFHTRNTPR